MPRFMIEGQFTTRFTKFVDADKQEEADVIAHDLTGDDIDNYEEDDREDLEIIDVRELIADFEPIEDEDDDDNELE